MLARHFRALNFPLYQQSAISRLVKWRIFAVFARMFLRYWEQEFSQLSPQKRRGNRRYYQHHEVVLIRKIRALLYEEGFTICGARNRLEEARGELRLRDELLAVLEILSK